MREGPLIGLGADTLVLGADTILRNGPYMEVNDLRWE